MQSHLDGGNGIVYHYASPTIAATRKLHSCNTNYLLEACARCVMKGCLRASVGVILLSGFSAKHFSSRSMKWLSSLVSASSMPLDAARRRVRRSRVGLIMGKVLTAVCKVDLVSKRDNQSDLEGHMLFLTWEDDVAWR